MSKRFSKSIISGATLGSLAVVLLSATGPAEAKPNSCLRRYHACTNRCVGNNYDAYPCINRTCNRQYDNCMGAGGGARLVAPIRSGGFALGPQTPFEGGGRRWPFGIDGARQTGGSGPSEPVLMSPRMW